ncbi:MAG: hypothetical protein L7W43_10335 [Rubripirellula sp.]|nr:hypothetical protein [Rubripirellula sp.]
MFSRGKPDGYGTALGNINAGTRFVSIDGKGIWQTEDNNRDQCWEVPGRYLYGIVT